MPFKTIFTVLKKDKVPRFLGRPLQTFELEGTRPLRPPAFDGQGNGLWKGAHGHQRCQFVKTVEVAEAWGRDTNVVWGRRNCAFSSPQSLRFMFLLGFWSLCFKKTHKTYFLPKL